MPPRKKAPAARSAPQPRRSTRQPTKSRATVGNNAIPEVFQELLAEAARDDGYSNGTSSRPSKRRKVTPLPSDSVDDLFESPPPPSPPTAPPPNGKEHDVSAAITRPQQIVFDDFEGSDESDIEFEDVELEPAAQSDSDGEMVEVKPLQLDLSKSALETPKRNVQRRKPVSKAERMMRLDVHKWHLLSLVGHGLRRNSWCNSPEVHAILKPLISRKLIKILHLDESRPLYERNHSFIKGIEEICILWRQQWQTTIPGLHRAYWREATDARDAMDNSEDVDFDDFKSAARKCRGSRDLGAQLFTALLRSIAVESRLVFSLQVLPLTSAAKADTPSKHGKDQLYIHAPEQNYGASANFSSPFTAPSRPKKSKKIVDSPYPVFWTEVLTPHQTWTPIDPIVRQSISKPKTQFEPSLSDNLNSMTYVIAFEDDNSAHDVTRRYTQWFNAKTRKLRVESTKNGEEWYKSAMWMLRKRFREPRDEVEAGELAKRVNNEGMPNNIQDFKNHPVYVLERHMRANEVLQPKREVGKVNVGTSKNGKIESVYRRQDVHLCRTADAWYRRGRDVRMGEQPLKQVVPKSRRERRAQSIDQSDEEEEADGVGVYAEYQTNIYEPPPVVDGQIPKNAYGNLDVYVPSMIPPGAVHVMHPQAAVAARVVGIDSADAITGFDFKGRQGTPVVNGIVVAEQFTAAVATVIDGLETLGSEEVQQARSRILTATWKRMLQALRVRERVETEYGSGVQNSKTDSEDGSTYEDEEDQDVGGGFVHDDEPTAEKVQEQAVNLQILKTKMPTALPEEVIRVPIQITRSPHKAPARDKKNDSQDRADDADNELFEDDAHEGAFRSDYASPGEGGGFLPEDDDNTAEGGFLPDAIPVELADEAMDNLHSDVEEDAALQIAIAKSLARGSETTSPKVTDSPKAEQNTGDFGVPSPDVAVRSQESATLALDTTTGEIVTDAESPSSLLSHDPNEDEEDPGWLDEALE